MFKQLSQIQASYNQAAPKYNQDRVGLSLGHAWEIFLEHLLKSKKHLDSPVKILDLGCGDGLAVVKPLLDFGFVVTGLDFSDVQLRFAQKNCPTGRFLLKNLADLKPAEFQVNAITCLYTLFHLPRKTHLEVIKTLASFLPKSGWLLITMGDKDFEGWHSFYGTSMWSSHYGSAKNLQLIKAAGFSVTHEEIIQSNQETHQIVLAQKN